MEEETYEIELHDVGEELEQIKVSNIVKEELVKRKIISEGQDVVVPEGAYEEDIGERGNIYFYYPFEVFEEKGQEILFTGIAYGKALPTREIDWMSIVIPREKAKLDEVS
jgi:hypothetical protein